MLYAKSCYGVIRKEQQQSDAWWWTESCSRKDMTIVEKGFYLKKSVDMIWFALYRYKRSVRISASFA